MVALALFACPAPACAARRVTVSMHDFLEQMRALLPTEGSNRYAVPSRADERALAAAATALAMGDVGAAEHALIGYPDFEVLELADPGAGAYLALVEKPPVPRGWGFYFFARTPRRPQLVLEAPHPIADRDTELDAAIAAASLGPAAVLFAGAHRLADAGGLSD